MFQKVDTEGNVKNRSKKDQIQAGRSVRRRSQDLKTRIVMVERERKDIG